MDIRRLTDNAVSGTLFKQILFLAVITLGVFSLFVGLSFMLASNDYVLTHPNSKPLHQPQCSGQTNSALADNAAQHKMLDGAAAPEADDTLRNIFNEAATCEHNNRFWGLFTQFIDPGNIDKAHEEHRWFITLVALAGSATFGGLLIATLSNVIERRVDRIRNGEVDYRLSGHTVIVGYDPYAVAVIKQTIEHNPKQDILLFTSQNTHEVNKHLANFLDNKEEKRVILYHGGRDSEEQIHRLDLQRASVLYILGEPDDTERDFMNWHCFTLIQKELAGTGNKPSNKLVCHVLLQHFREYQLAQNYDLEDEENKYLEFRPINFHEEWSRLILSDIAACVVKQDNSENQQANEAFQEQNGERTPSPAAPIPASQLGVGSSRHLHLIVIGFDEAGKLFCANAMRALHFPNLSTTNITLIDPDIAEKFDHFKSHVPGYGSLDDIAFRLLAETPFSDTTRARLEEILDDDTALPYIVVCLNESDRSLAAGLNLPANVYRKKVPVLIRYNICYNDYGDIARLLHGSRYANVHFWGMMNTKIFDKDNLKLREVFAESAHNSYIETAKTLRFYKSDAETSKPYEQLKSVYQWANRYLADSYPIKLRAAGLSVIKKGCLYDKSRYEPVSVFDPEQLKALAQAEHARWIAERVVSSWSYGPRRDNIHKIHPNIAPWEQLDEATRQYDYVLVEHMLENLAQQGYIAVREIAPSQPPA